MSFYACNCRPILTSTKTNPRQKTSNRQSQTSQNPLQSRQPIRLNPKKRIAMQLAAASSQPKTRGLKGKFANALRHVPFRLMGQNHGFSGVFLMKKTPKKLNQNRKNDKTVENRKTTVGRLSHPKKKTP